MPRSPVFLLVLVCLGVPPALAEDRAVEWVVASNGFPGTRAGSEPTRQRLTARGARLRILDPHQGRVVYLDLDRGRWQEGFPAQRAYREHDLAELAQRRARDEERRARALAQARRQRQRLLDRDDAQALRELDRQIAAAGLSLEGPDRVRLEHFPQDDRPGELVVDGQPRAVTLEHYQVRVNQARDPVVELWITRDLELPLDLLAFYRGTGLLRPEVTAQLAQVPGVVVEAALHLQQGALSQVLTTRVLRLRTTPRVSAADLVLPPGWQPLPDEDGDATPADRCATCGGPLGDAPLGFKDGARFCCSAHRRAYARAHGAGR